MDTVEKNRTWYVTTGANNSPTLALVFPMTTGLGFNGAQLDLRV